MRNDADIQALIQEEFPKMKTPEDLLVLLNKVKRFLDKGNGQKFAPMRMKSLNYYKNIKASGKRRYRTFSIKKNPERCE